MRLEKTRPIVFLACFICFVGCEMPSRWIELQPPVIEQPIANIPNGVRWTNWPDAKGSGSCVIASSCSLFEWSNRPDLAKKFRQSYAGGQTEESIKKKYRANKIKFVCTCAQNHNEYSSSRNTAEDRGFDYGDPAILDWATQTRRGAIIWYFDNHCVTFCGFGQHNGQEVAFLLDNNRTQQFIPIERNQFLRNWRSKYGGFAAVPLNVPVPPIPFQGYSVLGGK
jgi:hypothetical protein